MEINHPLWRYSNTFLSLKTLFRVSESSYLRQNFVEGSIIEWKKSCVILWNNPLFSILYDRIGIGTNYRSLVVVIGVIPKNYSNRGKLKTFNSFSFSWKTNLLKVKKIYIYTNILILILLEFSHWLITLWKKEYNHDIIKERTNTTSSFAVCLW